MNTCNNKQGVGHRTWAATAREEQWSRVPAPTISWLLTLWSPAPRARPHQPHLALRITRQNVQNGELSAPGEEAGGEVGTELAHIPCAQRRGWQRLKAHAPCSEPGLCPPRQRATISNSHQCTDLWTSGGLKGPGGLKAHGIHFPWPLSCSLHLRTSWVTGNGGRRVNSANVRGRRLLPHLRTASNNLATLHSSVKQVLRIIQKEERKKPYNLHMFSLQWSLM